MTWLSCELLTLGCSAAGAYRSLKTLKDGEVDFEVLVYWTVLGVVRLYTSYFEWIFAWFPFYYYLKSLVLIALLVPRLRAPRIMFHTLVVPSIAYAHKRLSEEIPKGVMLLQALPMILLNTALDIVFPGAGRSLGNGLENVEKEPEDPSVPLEDRLRDKVELHISEHS